MKKQHIAVLISALCAGGAAFAQTQTQTQTPDTEIRMSADPQRAAEVERRAAEIARGQPSTTAAGTSGGVVSGEQTSGAPGIVEEDDAALRIEGETDATAGAAVDTTDEQTSGATAVEEGAAGAGVEAAEEIETSGGADEEAAAEGETQLGTDSAAPAVNGTMGGEATSGGAMEEEATSGGAMEEEATSGGVMEEEATSGGAMEEEATSGGTVGAGAAGGADATVTAPGATDQVQGGTDISGGTGTEASGASGAAESQAGQEYIGTVPGTAVGPAGKPGPAPEEHETSGATEGAPGLMDEPATEEEERQRQSQ